MILVCWNLAAPERDGYRALSRSLQMRALYPCIDCYFHTRSFWAKPAVTPASPGASAYTGPETHAAPPPGSWGAVEILKPTTFPFAHTCSVFMNDREGDVDVPCPCHKHSNGKDAFSLIYLFLLAKLVPATSLEFCCWSPSLPVVAEV